MAIKLSATTVLWQLTAFLFATVESQFCSNGQLSPFTGFCYHLHGEKEGKFEDARKICRSQYGGDVPSIFDTNENNFVQSVISSSSYSVFWLGVTDLAVEDDHRTLMTDQPISFSAWGGADPDERFGNEDCVRMTKSTGEWSDNWCSTFITVGLVCQEPPLGLNNFTGCPANMVPYQTSTTTECYWFSFDRDTALSASSACSAIGAELAVVIDENHNTFLNSYLPTTGAQKAWIGVQQILDGAGPAYTTVQYGGVNSVSYTNFADTYSGSENPVCVYMDREQSGQWIQGACDSSTHYYICHYNNHTTSGSTPITSHSAFTTPSTTTTASTVTTPFVTTSVDTTPDASTVFQTTTPPITSNMPTTTEQGGQGTTVLTSTSMSTTTAAEIPTTDDLTTQSTLMEEISTQPTQTTYHPATLSMEPQTTYQWPAETTAPQVTTARIYSTATTRPAEATTPQDTTARIYSTATTSMPVTTRTSQTTLPVAFTTYPSVIQVGRESGDATYRRGSHTEDVTYSRQGDAACFPHFASLAYKG